MEQTDSSQKLGSLSLEDLEDIPVAFREEAIAPPSSSFPWPIWGMGAGAIALTMAAFFLTSGVFSFEQLFPPQKTEVKVFLGPPIPNPFPQPENLLGHLAYSEIDPAQLKPITSDGRFLMQATAAQKFWQMQAAARASGIKLEVISGFRSLEEQQRLFFEVKEQRGQQVSKRAEVSAPPGYSEHHTGYAIDIGDANFPNTHLNQAFENTPAYQWLAKNAAYYSFELSFPKDNLQGVSYEPWHWRFVGDIQSLETFYKAKNLHQPIKNQP